MKILKSVLEETLAKIGGFKDKDHSTVSFIIEKGVLTLLVRNDVDYAMRKLDKVEALEGMESFAIDVSELMYAESVNFEFIDNKVQIKSGIISLKANKSEIEKVARTKSENMAKLTLDADKFVEAISLASNAIEVSAIFTGCVAVNVVDKKAKIQALDGVTGIFDYMTIDADKDFTLNIPKEKIQLFKGMAGEYKGVYDIDNQVLFATDGEYMFSIKLKDFKFSDFREQLKFGDSLVDIVKQSEVVLDISKEELSKCVSLFKGMKEGVYAEFRKEDNKHTLTCEATEKTVTVELMGKAMVRGGDVHLFYFDINRIKWIQHLKEDKIFVFFKKYHIDMNDKVEKTSMFNKIVPYDTSEGEFNEISSRKVGLFLPVKNDKVNAFYKGLEGGEKEQEEKTEDVAEEESEQTDAVEEVEE